MDYTRQFSDRVESDSYGTAWATQEGASKKPKHLMFEAHADEIGYIVKYISKDGFLSVDRVGGNNATTACGRSVDILGDKGNVRGIIGIIGNSDIHIREDRENEKVPRVHEIWIDIGATSDKEVAKAGVRVGHPALYSDTVEEFGSHRLFGRALDNRVGGFIIPKSWQDLAKARNASLQPSSL
jgi:endoglucanase